MHLLRPGKIGNLVIKNRVVLAPMGVGGMTEPDGNWGDAVREYYLSRARGGVGLITTMLVFVTQDLEPFSRLYLDIHSDSHLASLRRVIEGAHEYDSRVSVQLTAGFGRVLTVPRMSSDTPPVSASENSCYFDPLRVTRALTTEETVELARAFGRAAGRCREAGADAVELHGHEGYLLDQFMTSLWNRRTDRYGGSPKKRLNLVREALAAIRRDAGHDFPVIYRYGITHYLDGGRDIEESLWIARELEKMGFDALHVDAGCYETHWWPHPPTYQPPGCMVDMAAAVKKVVSIPVIAVGRLHYPHLAEQVLAEAKADFIAIGRGLLAEPEWVNKVARQEYADISPCIGCHDGCLVSLAKREAISCTLNPVCGHEIEWRTTKLKKPRSLLVVGGGPAGITAARVAAERGFKVTLWEQSERLGGNLWPAAIPDFKHDLRDLIHHLRYQIERLPVEVILNRIATVAAIRDFGADYLILSTGATMETQQLEEADGQVITAIDVLLGRNEPGDRVVVMGGGLIGCETAVHLARQGKQVTLTSRRSALLEDVADRNNRVMLQNMLADAGVRIITEAIPKGIEADHVVIAHQSETSVIPADSLVFSGRLQPKDRLWQDFRNDKRVYPVGDCVAPRRIINAVWEAYHTVRQIEP